MQNNAVSEELWLNAVAAYELGTHHAVEIAAELGVSPATVSREFKRRGARKACRVAETMVDLEAALDAKARREASRRRVEEAAELERLRALNAVIGDMVKNLLAADRVGSLASFAPQVTEIGKALGVKGLR